jgi:hypothetical protein
VRRGARVLAAIAAGGGAGALVACATVLNVEPNRHLTGPADAARLVDWSCLSNPSEELDPNEQVDLTVLVMDGTQISTAAGAVDGGSDLDTVSGSWLSGVTVRECAMLDLDCRSNSVMSSITDDAGRANFRLPQDFMGFFDVRRPDLVPLTLYPGRFLVDASPVSYPAFAVSPFGLSLLAGTIMADAGVDPTGTLGHALVTIYDCQDHQAPGVTLHFETTGPDTVPFYFFMGLPTRDTTTTDDFGLGGAVNVPTGTETVTAELPASGGRAPVPVGMATFTVRPGAITQAWIRARTH